MLRGDLDHQRIVYEVYEPIIDKSMKVAGSRVCLGGSNPPPLKKGTHEIFQKLKLIQK